MTVTWKSRRSANDWRRNAPLNSQYVHPVSINPELLKNSLTLYCTLRRNRLFWCRNSSAKLLKCVVFMVLMVQINVSTRLSSLVSTGTGSQCIPVFLFRCWRLESGERIKPKPPRCMNPSRTLWFVVQSPEAEWKVLCWRCVQEVNLSQRECLVKWHKHQCVCVCVWYAAHS